MQEPVWDAALRQAREDRDTYFRLLAAYLGECPRLVTREMMEELTSSCAVSRPRAFCAVLSAAFGWEEETDADAHRLFHTYLLPSVRELRADDYRADPYFKNIRVPQKRVGNWCLTEERYAPYEGLLCGPLSVTPDFAEIPPLGYFTEEFAFPAVMQDGREWMAIKPNEIETMRAPVSHARGNVLTLGLGMGYYAYLASERAEVETVTVVERDPAVIELFRTELLPQFGHGEKIRVVEGDALLLAEREFCRGYDTIFADLWHDAGDGLPLYVKLRRIEAAAHCVPVAYWVEDMILSELRALVWRQLERNPPPSGVLRTMLSADYLRDLAKDMRQKA